MGNTKIATQAYQCPKGNQLMTETLSFNYLLSCPLAWDTFILLLRISQSSIACNNSMLRKVLRCLTLIIFQNRQCFMNLCLTLAWGS